MSNMLPRLPETGQKIKSFWERPEGTTGMIFLAVVALSVIYFGGPLLLGVFGTLTALLGQAIAIIALGSVLALLLFIVSNKRVHTLIKVIFQQVMRWLTGLVVEIDPIGIMRSHIEDLGKKQGVIDGSIETLTGQLRKCQRNIDNNQEIYDNEMQKASLAKRNGHTAAMTIAAKQAERVHDLNEKRLKPLAFQMQAHIKMLRKYSDVTTIVRTDLQNEVDIKVQERDMITSSYNAISAAKRIIQGGNDERAMFDMAMESVANDYAMKLGAIENFIENSRGFMDSMDLQNGVYEENAMARLAEWEQRADQILIDGGHADLVTPALDHTSKVAEFTTEKSYAHAR